MGDKIVPCSLQSKITANKMLADLLDKKSLEPPAFNISPDQSGSKRKIDQTSDANESEQLAKKAQDESGGMNDGGRSDNIKPSTKLADLYAKLAGSILEDEDMEEDVKPVENVIMQQQPAPTVSVISQQPQQQQQKMINLPVPMQRQIIVTPNNNPAQQMMLSTSNASGPTTIVTQNQNQQQLQQPMQQQQQQYATIKTETGYQTVPIILQHSTSGGGITANIQMPKQQINVGQQQQQHHQIMHHQQPTTIMAAPQQQQPTQYILATNPQGNFDLCSSFYPDF
jgi:AT-rich interactive domain-containing protein 2